VGGMSGSRLGRRREKKRQKEHVNEDDGESEVLAALETNASVGKHSRWILVADSGYKGGKTAGEATYLRSPGNRRIKQRKMAEVRQLRKPRGRE